MTEPLYVLPVQQPDANALATGRTRQLSRNFAPADPVVVGRWVAIQATAFSSERKRLGLLPHPEWAIVAVGKLTGAGYYPGFARDPTEHLGRSYKREKGKAGAWVWTFSNVTQLAPIKLEGLSEKSWRGGDRNDYRIDDGSGDWWGCFPRALDPAMVDAVREARRKAKARK